MCKSKRVECCPYSAEAEERRLKSAVTAVITEQSFNSNFRRKA